MSTALRDWCVTYARKVAGERDYSSRHPGHVFTVMLDRDEAEGLLAQVHALIEVQARIGETRYDPECHCCRETQDILAEFQSRLLASVAAEGAA